MLESRQAGFKSLCSGVQETIGAYSSWHFPILPLVPMAPCGPLHWDPLGPYDPLPWDPIAPYDPLPWDPHGPLPWDPLPHNTHCPGIPWPHMTALGSRWAHMAYCPGIPMAPYDPLPWDPHMAHCPGIPMGRYHDPLPKDPHGPISWPTALRSPWAKMGHTFYRHRPPDILPGEEYQLNLLWPLLYKRCEVKITEQN
jgi:hypothetical protein